MKAKSIEGDVPGTLKLCHNCVSFLVTSVVQFPDWGNLPSPGNSVLSEHCDGHSRFNSRVRQPK